MQVFSLCGLCFLVHICSKNKYSFKYESSKRKFELYPNSRDKTQTPKNDDWIRAFALILFYIFIIIYLFFCVNYYYKNFINVIFLKLNCNIYLYNINIFYYIIFYFYYIVNRTFYDFLAKNSQNSTFINQF